MTDFKYLDIEGIQRSKEKTPAGLIVPVALIEIAYHLKRIADTLETLGRAK